MKLSELNPAQYNPREITAEALHGLKYSLEEFGDLSGITFNLTTGNTVSGHQRIKALTEQYGDLDIEKLTDSTGRIKTPDGNEFVVRFVEWSLEVEQAANIAANSPTIQGTFTPGVSILLNKIEVELPNVFGSLNLKNFLINGPDKITEEENSALPTDSVQGVTTLAPQEENTNSAEYFLIKPVVVTGDVFELGTHKLICGDARNSDTIATLFSGDDKCDLLVTDPPYGIATKGAKAQWAQKQQLRDIENDELKGEDLIQFLTESFCTIPFSGQASFYICYDHWTQSEFVQAIERLQWRRRSTIVWKKTNNGLGYAYRRQHELILFGQVFPEQKLRWLGGEDESDVWEYSRAINSGDKRPGNHPTPKPLPLIERAIKNSSEEHNVVLDLFLGSGTTLIACENLNRSCYGVEIDPHYTESIIKRWSDAMIHKGQDPFQLFQHVNGSLSLSDILNNTAAPGKE